FELVVSESQERMTVAVPADKMTLFLALAERRAVEVSELGEFTDTGRFDVLFGERLIASIDLQFLHKGNPQLELVARFAPPAAFALPAGKEPQSANGTFEDHGGKTLLALLGRPNIASKEWLIRQYDHEVQGMSVVKPLHIVGAGTGSAWSGPNDAGVVKPKPSSEAGLAIGCGILPRLSDLDPYLMAQASVDEAVRNILAVGAEFGNPDSVLSICDNFCWPDPVSDPAKMAALVRACYGLQDAALALHAPLVSGKDSMKNDFRGKRRGQPVTISVVPTLLITAVGRVSDVRHARTADFKSVGDLIYLLRAARPGLPGSELEALASSRQELHARGFAPGAEPGRPDWERARKLYSWLGGTTGKLQPKLRSVHDVSEGGLLVAIAESCLARGVGADIAIPEEESNPWQFAFGEGFHGFVVSVPEAEAQAFEREWAACEVPFVALGSVTSEARLGVKAKGGGGRFSVPVSDIRLAWLREGYWE
ncbi:MAG TPA: AIR synthase-related protein, partial [Bdellovibrionota bacterium]|nr:AIR synthase-related protein [Bdellovibrionota bacterium]